MSRNHMKGYWAVQIIKIKYSTFYVTILFSFLMPFCTKSKVDAICPLFDVH